MESNSDEVEPQFTCLSQGLEPGFHTDVLEAFPPPAEEEQSGQSYALSKTGKT